MDNNQGIPFEKNRYYPGKMLTSADFQTEQMYMKSKSNFMNHMMFGSGIVCGLGVFNLDDLSILVESGVAIDGYGREIVVPSSVVKKLSAIEGYDRLSGSDVSVCVRFQESLAHPVYSVNRQERGSEYEYNRVLEGYELVLVDTDSLTEHFVAEETFLVKWILYAQEDYEVALTIPAAVPIHKQLKVRLSIKKLSEVNQQISYTAILQMPDFMDDQGEHECLIEIEALSLKKGETKVKDYWVNVGSQELKESSLLIDASKVSIELDGVKIESIEEVCQDIQMKVSVSAESMDKLIIQEVEKESLEIKQLGGFSELIRVADLKVVRTENAYFIDSVKEKQVKKFMFLPADYERICEYREYFREKPESVSSETMLGRTRTTSVTEQTIHPHVQMTTGVVEIPFPVNAKKGDVFYSEEVMHGLRKGNVFVNVGLEYMVSDEDSVSVYTIYGDASLFRMENLSNHVDFAVKVLNDRGSFIVAARPTVNPDYILLHVRWTAFRLNTSGGQGEESSEGRTISASSPTIRLKTREEQYVHVDFWGMPPCPLIYELTEPNSGEVTANGIYKAPAKEGVYEIRIYCLDEPSIVTYVYAVVV